MSFSLHNRASRFTNAQRSISIAVRLLASLPIASTAFSQTPGQIVVDTGTCYRLTLGHWSHHFPSGWPAIHIPPEIVRFDAAPDSSRPTLPGYMKLQPNIAAIDALRRHREPIWTQVGVDSLRLVWSTGFSGVMLELGIRGDSLTGIAVAMYDVKGPPVPKANVVGRRTTCPPSLAR